MTGKEAVLAAMNQQPTDRPVVTLITGGEWYFNYANQPFADAKTSPEKICAVFEKAYRSIGHDMIWPGAGLLNYPTHCLGAPIIDNGTDTPALTAPAIDNLDKLDELPWKAALEDPIIVAMNTSSHLIGQAIGDETFVMPTQWGPFTTAARIMGAEQLMIATIQQPDALKELIKRSAVFVWAMCERMLEHPNVMGVNFSEPVASGDMISPTTFEHFVEPDLGDLINKTKAAGKYTMMHICGNTTPILPKIKAMAPHAFSLEAKVDLGVAKEVLGGQVCVAGNVSPTEAFLNGSPDEVIAVAGNCLEIWGDDPGYILTVGCDFPKEVPLDNIKALMLLKG